MPMQIAHLPSAIIAPSKQSEIKREPNARVAGGERKVMGLLSTVGQQARLLYPATQRTLSLLQYPGGSASSIKVFHYHCLRNWLRRPRCLTWYATSPAICVHYLHGVMSLVTRLKNTAYTFSRCQELCHMTSRITTSETCLERMGS